RLVAFSPSGDRLAFAGYDNKLQIYRTSRRQAGLTSQSESDALRRADEQHRFGIKSLVKSRNPAQAAVHYEQALRIRRKVLGEEDPKTATLISDLGFVLLLMR